VALLGAIEYAWNVYPSTTLSSSLLCLSNTILIVGVWFGDAQGKTVNDAENARVDDAQKKRRQVKSQ
jgi:alpha-1,3-mannosyltransferase